MAEFFIQDGDLHAIKGKTVVVTGGSSGIGLSTVELLLSLGASVVSGDIQSSSTQASPAYLFVQTDVTSWTDLATLFKTAKQHFGRIDSVFANAGIGPRANYLALKTDSDGDLKEPTHAVLDINLKSTINTATLALHYLKQQSEGGSLVIMGSSTGLQPLRAPDYSIAKHGVLGLGRCFSRLVEAASLPIRINTLMPSWTNTQVLPDLEGIMKAISHEAQSPSVVAEAAVYLMADKIRHGEVVYVADGKYTEIENAILAPAYASVIGQGKPSDDEILTRILALSASA